MSLSKFSPTAETVHAERKKTGEGMMTIKKRHQVANINKAIGDLPFTDNHVKDVLRAILELAAS